jgi:NAD(P)-dependent dehydrogenase (short-subunit alcohol dehydrogenase family)
MQSSFEGKIFVVTGATSGIGLAAAQGLARLGGSVIGVGRSAERCRALEANLRELNPEGAHRCCVADLALQSQVRGLAREIRTILADWRRPGPAGLDGLVNNAGTFTYWLALTAEGFETQWAVNHLAPFLLTHELLPALRSAPGGWPARIVTVSSESHAGASLRWEDIQLRRRYDGLLAYRQTKLANILFTAELNRRLGAGTGLRAFAADPGLVKTDIGYKGTPGMVRWLWNLRRSAGDPPEVAARNILFLLDPENTEKANSHSDGDLPVYWRGCAPKQPSRQARDGEAARRLWEMSERMCGMQATQYLLASQLQLEVA